MTSFPQTLKYHVYKLKESYLEIIKQWSLYYEKKVEQKNTHTGIFQAFP